MTLTKKEENKIKKSLLKKLRAKLTDEKITKAKDEKKQSAQFTSDKELIDMFKESDLLFLGLDTNIRNNMSQTTFTVNSNNETIRISNLLIKLLRKIISFMKSNKLEIKNYSNVDLAKIKKELIKLKGPHNPIHIVREVEDFLTEHEEEYENADISTANRRTYVFYLYVFKIVEEIYDLIDEITKLFEEIK